MSEKSLKLYSDYIDRPSESFAYILKSTNCQQRGHAPVTADAEKEITASHQGEPTSATVNMS